jgi:hypothetical protein
MVWRAKDESYTSSRRMIFSDDRERFRGCLRDLPWGHPPACRAAQWLA